MAKIIFIYSTKYKAQLSYSTSQLFQDFTVHKQNTRNGPKKKKKPKKLL